jgi:hypothetical protein
MGESRRSAVAKTAGNRHNLCVLLQARVGCESLAEFFQLLGLERHMGVSVSSLRQIRKQMETQILDYQRLQQSQLEHPQTPVEACVSVDETFFDQVVLVLLDLPSGFILVEEMSQDYRYETWQHHTQQALSKLGLNIHYLSTIG